jgi:hypothetical protein
MKNYYNEDVLKLISEQILNKSIDELKEIYLKFEKKQIEIIETYDTNLEYRKYLDAENVAKNRQFDLPFLLPHNGINKLRGTIIILGMDAKGHGDKRVVLSTPYAIHLGKSDPQYFNYINTLRQYYNIYLTDIYKTYWMNKDGSFSNGYLEFTRDKIHLEILKNEVEILKNAGDFIGFLTWGDQARDGVLHMYDLACRKTSENPKGFISKEQLLPYMLTQEFKLIASTHPTRGNGHKGKYFKYNNLGDKWDPIIMAEAIINAFDVN